MGVEGSRPGLTKTIRAPPPNFLNQFDNFVTLCSTWPISLAPHVKRVTVGSHSDQVVITRRYSYELSPVTGLYRGFHD